MTIKEPAQLMEKYNRLTNLKKDNKESGKALENMNLSWQKAKQKDYLVRNKKTTMIITRNNQALNFKVYSDFILKVEETAKKLDINSPHQLTQVGLPPPNVRVVLQCKYCTGGLSDRTVTAVCPISIEVCLIGQRLVSYTGTAYAGSDSRPPILDKTDFKSWQQRIHLYYLGKDNGVNIHKSIDEGLFKMGKFRETLAEGSEGVLHLGPERDRVFDDLTP
nr:integrase, catalytic region, zinc finger, CCHC-type, peptidase aspartic, catalytic [Tanacetum cinerariifolium]